MNSKSSKRFIRFSVLTLAVAMVPAFAAGTASAADCGADGLPVAKAGVTPKRCLTSGNSIKPSNNYTATLDLSTAGCSTVSGCIPVRALIKTGSLAGSYTTGYSTAGATGSGARETWVRANCTAVTGGYTCTSAQDPVATQLNQWQRCDASNRSCLNTSSLFTNITGATGAWYNLGTSDIGFRVRNDMTITTSGGASGDVVTQDNPTFAGFAPVAVHCNGGCLPAIAGQGNATQPPTITGTASAGSTLTANPGFWQGFRTGSSFQYGFQRCTQALDANQASGGNCQDILTGPVGWKYKLTTSDRSYRIRAKITLTQTIGSNSYTVIAYSATTGIVS